MKIKSLIYSLVALASLVISACVPEEHSLGGVTYVSDDLVHGIAYEVSVDGNEVTLQSLIDGAVALWETPQGRSQSSTMKISLPFAGTYSVTFGILTDAGPVYGAPYSFDVTENDFSMLSDEIWANLAGGVESSRKWVPINGAYGIGRCSGPLMYMSPTDVKNDGTGLTELLFGSDNWTPNWDPGMPDWLIGPTDPYLDSYMTLGLSATEGCTAEVFRNDANGGTLMKGKFVLNISNPKQPLISFDGCYSLHNEGFDSVCDNYNTNLHIIECTPYLLQIATMRTNSEGPWWLVWNFISAEAAADPSILPKEESGLLTTIPVVEPEYEDLAAELFKIAGSGAYYQATATTYLMNEDAPYDWMWWNEATGAWESNGFDSADDYSQKWNPAYPTAGDFEMQLATTSTEGTYTCDVAGVSTTFTIQGNKLVFADEVTLLSAANDYTTVEIKGTEFTVMKVSADDAQVVLGVPAGVDASGAVNKYLCANLVIKPISSNNGPVEVKFDASKLNPYFETNNNAHQFRFDLYNPWAPDNNIVDPAKVKLKKNQKLVLKFKVDGIAWKEGVTTTKLAISDNAIINVWGADVFAHETAIDVPTDSSEKTIELVNNTGATINFEGSSCISICMETTDKIDGPLDEEGAFDSKQVTVEITSISIHTIQ